MKINRSKNRIVSSKLIALVSAFLISVPFSFGKGGDGVGNGLKTDNLTVNIDDVVSLFNIEAEWVREDLLETAFYDAARRAKLKDYDIEYNGVKPKNAKHFLDFDVIEWRRSPANFYEFRARAVYYDADGKPMNLGVVHGTRSGLSVFNRYDIGDHFAKSAEDAFRQALKKLNKNLS